jgi:hypothetical protein
MMRVRNLKILIQSQRLLLSDWGAKRSDTDELVKFEELLEAYEDMSIDEFCSWISDRPQQESSAKSSRGRAGGSAPNELAQSYISRFRTESPNVEQVFQDLKSDSSAKIAVLKIVAGELLGAASDIKKKDKLLSALEAWVRRQVDRSSRVSNVEGGL